MRRALLLALFALTLACLPARAQTYARVAGFCQVGAQQIVLSGLNQSAPPAVQASYPACTVAVYASGTTNLISPIYSDHGTTIISNPTSGSSTTGYWFFYVATGTDVDVTISGGGLVTPFTFGDIVAGGSGGGGGGGSIPNPPAANYMPYSLSSTTSAWAALANCNPTAGSFTTWDPTGANNPSGVPAWYCSGNGPYVLLSPNAAAPGNFIVPSDNQTTAFGISQFPGSTQDLLQMYSTPVSIPATDTPCALQPVNTCSLWIDSNFNVYTVGGFFSFNNKPFNVPDIANPCSGGHESPAGSALTWFDSTALSLATCDSSGNVVDYIGAAGTATLTGKTINCAVSGNVCDVNSLAMSTNVGNSTAVQRAGTNSGTPAAPLCNDANSNSTTSGCPIPPTESTNSQTNLSITGTGNQTVVILTPGSTGMYRVSVVAYTATAASVCSPAGTVAAVVSWQDGAGNTQSATGSTFTPTVLGNGGAVGLSIPIWANAGQPISGGIHVTAAAASCTTFPLISTQMEALP